MPNKEFKVMIVRMLTKLESRIEIVEFNENCNKKLENVIRNQSKLKNKISKIKNTPGKNQKQIRKYKRTD